jgi:hypothetical protein
MAMPGSGRGGDGPADLGNDGDLESELALIDGDERLPWLESDDEFDEPGVDTGRVVAFALLGLLAVLLIVGALWVFLRDSTGGVPAADGSVIEAPDEPYRTRPENPGGRQVAGTGNASFEVAEGLRVEGKIAETAPAPVPASEKVVPAKESKPVPVAENVIGVQVGAYASRSAAEAGWVTLTGRLEPLQGRNHRVVEGMADSGTVFRLQALAGSMAEAQALCQSVKAAGGDCQVKR